MQIRLIMSTVLGWILKPALSSEKQRIDAPLFLLDIFLELLYIEQNPRKTIFRFYNLYHIQFYKRINQKMKRGFTHQKPLCKFINDCRSFKNGNCPYSHDNCRFGDKCNDKQKCKFYHPQLPPRNRTPIERDASFSKPKMPCKFGNDCHKNAKGICPFLHDSSVQPKFESKKIHEPCKFGNKCKNLANGTCRFFHPSSNNNNTSQYNSFNPSIQKPSAQELAPLNLKQLFELQQKQCSNFIQNCCDSELNCQYQHSFTSDKSIRRLFHTNRIMLTDPNSPENHNSQFLKILKIDTANESNKQKSIIFSILRIQNFQNLIGFYEIDEQLKLLKSVTAHDFQAQSKILGFYCTNNTSQLIFITQNKTLTTFNPQTGQLQQILIQNPTQVINVEKICGQKIVIIAYPNTLFAYQDGKPQQKLQGRLNQIDIKQITVFKKYTIFEEQMLIVGNKNGEIVFINSQLGFEKIVTDNQKCVSDFVVVKCFGKPYCFATLANAKNQSSALFAINLLTFQSTIVLVSTQGLFSKIACIYDKFFIAVDYQSVFIYQQTDFRTPIGQIPIGGQIKSLLSQQEEGLLIVEQNWRRGRSDPKTNLSMFRVKKP